MNSYKKLIFIVGLLALLASCRNDPSPQKPKIDKIVFEESAKSLFIGDVVRVNIAAEPKNAKEHDTIIYKTTESGIIEIKAESGNDGVVFEGLKRGSTIITATVNGIVDYCSITVMGGDESVIPHILVPYHVIECRENERRSIVASLAGGTPLDDQGFVWSFNNQRVISLESTGNVGVFDTLDIGQSVITISHPKAQFSVDILVYVTGNDEVPVYITTDSNVIRIKKSDGNIQYEVGLRGGDSGDFYGFIHNVTEGQDVIDVRYNNNIGTITPKDRGIARIRVTHGKTVYPLEITVIVSEEIEHRYIDVDRTLIIMEEGSIESIRAEFAGDVPPDYIDRFGFENDDDSIIGITQSYNSFFISGLRKGKSVLKIKNSYADFDREVLVIVNGTGDVHDNEVYISTNQNVITTEAGDDVLLTMVLVGGNEADRNNFVWTVDDGSIIDVESAHGRVEYKNRAITGNTGDKFEAQAIIRAKKTGTARITLENPKAKNSLSVIVKVYRKGTFGAVPAVIDGSPVFKVRIGEQLPAYLRIVTGSEKNVTNITWSSENNNIVTVSGSGLTGILEGRSAGITGITVNGDNVKHQYTATVIVGNDEYLENIPYIHVRNPFISVIRGETVSFRIICENMDNDAIADITVTNNSNELMEVLSYRDSITVTGVELGMGELIIGGAGINTIKITVMVEDYNINPDMPYYLQSERAIYGVEKDKKITLAVNLVGGSTVNERNIVWKIENDNVALLSGNGRQCLVSGRSAGQTVITVSHPKSHNQLEIVLYVVDTGEDVDGKVVAHVKERNILMGPGDTRYISIITNANDVQKNTFRWDLSNINVIDVNVSGDRIKALVTARGVGNATITVRYGSNTVPVVIYVSVVNDINAMPYINVPSIVEMVRGDAISINAVTSNIYDVHNIRWLIHDESIARIYGNGESCMVNALTGGSTVIAAEYDGAGFKKNILLYVYGSIAEMENSYVIAAEQSRYVINREDIINIGLMFGTRGYPEYDLHNIHWRTDNGTVLDVTGNGKNANVKGLNAGIGTIIVGSDMANTVEIEVEVRADTAKTGQYRFSINAQDRIKGILSGDYSDITVRVFNGNNEVFNISGIEFIAGNTDIISITPNGNTMRVHALSGREGQSYITVRHDLAEDTRILVYTALSVYGLENAWPVFAEKTNYLLQKGESITIALQTKDNDAAKLNNISYGLERNTGVISVSEKNRREITVSANNTGSDVILVRYNADIVQRIYISVTEGNYGLHSGYMVTENIIGLVLGEEYETTVNTNIAHRVFWKTQNDYIIGILDSSEKSAIIRGFNVGRTVLTARAGNVERSIVVFVCETEAELRQYQAINIEQRFFRIQKHENITVNINSYQGKVEGGTLYGDYFNYSTPYGDVIRINSAENGKFSVKGLNEGIAAIRVTNHFYNTEIVVYIEVIPVDEGKIGIVDRQYYITAVKTLYVINKNDRNIMISVSVEGDNFTGMDYWTWSGYDESIISVTSQRNEALLNPRKEGETEIRVSNRDCVNILVIKVIVGERFAVDNSPFPYIYVEKDLYEVSKDTGKISIPYNIVNMPDFNALNTGFEVYGGNLGITHDIHNRMINVSIHDVGIGKFDILYGNLRKEVYVLVKDTVDYGNIYLTTSENYVIATTGELRNINVQLMGYHETNSKNFSWSVNREDVIKLVGNGVAGHIYGVKEGEAVVTVKHPEAKYADLKINVRIVKDKGRESAIYLTTQRNVIETVTGAQNEQIYVQKVGGSMGKDHCTWSVSNNSIVDIININGYSAQLTVKNEGIARIQVMNEENKNYVLEIVVIVKRALGNGIYISSANTLYMMKPGDSQKRIAVSLVNGEVRDNNKFKWKMEYQSPSDSNVAVARGNVVTIIGSNEECFINAINEGVARIRVSNEKSERDLIITVYVTHFEEIHFSVPSKNIVASSNEFVGINVPSYEYMNDMVEVWSDNPSVCDVYYTSELVLLYGKDSGSTVIRARVNGKPGEAQLYVNVEKECNPNTGKIVVDRTLYVLNPKSEPLRINAFLSGPNIVDFDNDTIRWDVNKPGIIDVFPSNAPVSSSVGRQIQVSPRALGTVTVTVSHGYIEEPVQISIIVSDLNNNFRVSKNEIVINNMTPETIRAEIAGGTTKDYAEIKWTAKMQQKWDGTMLEVVRVMGSGREVILYPMNDGHTQVYALYGKHLEIIDIQVVSEYYFSFRNGNEYMWPGQKRELPFDVRPVNSRINWVNNIGINEEPVVTFGEVLGAAGENNSVTRYLLVEAKREGNAMVVGMTNGRIASVNIMVQYNYSFNIARNAGGKVKYSGSGYNHDGVSEIEYTVYPPDTYIKPVAATIPPGLEVEVILPDPDKEDGKGIVRFVGHREMVQMVEFQHYKAKANGNDKDTPVESATALRPVHVMYSFGEVIVPMPYFIRGEGIFSNPNRAGYLSYNGRTQGESLEKVVGGVNEYNLVMGDGDVHYLLFDKKFDTAHLRITGIEGDVYVPAGQDYGSDVNFRATHRNIRIDGVDHMAVVLEGGKDYIKYNRVMFDRELFLYVSSAYAADTYDASQNYRKVSLSRKIYSVPYQVTVATYRGPWLSMYHPPTVVGGGEAAYKEYYLIRNADIDKIPSNFFNSAKFIKSDPWLDQFHNSGIYTYFFDGSEHSGLVWNMMLGLYCKKEKIYRPAFTYSWQVYLNNMNAFSSSLNTSGLTYDNAGNINGGTVASYVMLDGITENITETHYMLVYEYDPDVLSSFADSVGPDGGSTNTSFDLQNWNTGRFTSDMRTSIRGYNSNYLYSSVNIEVEEPDEEAANANVTVSRLNVFKRSYVDANGTKISPVGVRLTDATFSAGSYNHGAKTIMDWNGLWERIHYQNIAELPSYGGGYGDTTLRPTGGALNGIMKGMSYSRRITGYESTQGGAVPIYEDVFYGPNVSGANIFGTPASNYGNTYFMSSLRGSYWLFAWTYSNRYSPARAQQKLVWENTGKRVVVPYYIFNRFPYRYEPHNGINVQAANIVTLNQGGGKPMPSLNKSVQKSIKGTLLIRYETFDFNDTMPSGGIIRINITYQVRQCHMMYGGSLGDSEINYTDESGAVREYEGSVQSFSESFAGKPDMDKYLQ